jgi:hypothetical protein
MIIGYFAVDFIEVENDQIINEHKINDINKKMKKKNKNNTCYQTFLLTTKMNK